MPNKTLTAHSFYTRVLTQRYFNEIKITLKDKSFEFIKDAHERRLLELFQGIGKNDGVNDGINVFASEAIHGKYCSKRLE